MRLLLDTHIYLWWLANSPRLSQNAITRISAAADVYVSSASMWEASIKSSLGRLDADLDELIRQLSAHQFLPLPIGMNHVALLSNLPNLHKDPFDRMLIAQAQAENLRLLSADRLLADYSPMVDLV